MPQIRSSSEVYGATQAPFFASGVPVAALVGDQQAAMFGQRCIAPGMVKCTYGAAYLAGLAVGYWSGQEEIDRQWKEDRRFEPAEKPENVQRLLAGWSRALKAALVWADA